MVNCEFQCHQFSVLLFGQEETNLNEMIDCMSTKIYGISNLVRGWSAYWQSSCITILQFKIINKQV